MKRGFITYENQRYGWNTYTMKPGITQETLANFDIFKKHFNMINNDLLNLIESHLFEPVVYANQSPARKIIAWEQKTPDPVLDSMLLQDFAIAQWFPKRKPKQGSTPGKGRAFIYDATEETMNLSKRFFTQVYEEDPYWIDQCQVANWAIQGVENSWTIYCLCDADDIPLYYLILARRSAKLVEMKGIWKSLYGTLKYKALHKPFPSGKAFYLLRDAITHNNLRHDAMVQVQLRVGLKKMLNKYDICVQHIGKIPKTQGASVFGQFPIIELLVPHKKIYKK